MYLVLIFRPKKKLVFEKLSFKTQLNIEFLWLYTGHKKVFENIPGCPYLVNAFF